MAVTKKTAASATPKAYDGKKAQAFLNLEIIRADGTAMKLEKGSPLYNDVAKDAGVIAWAKSNPGKSLQLRGTVHLVDEEKAEANFDFA